MKKKVPAVDRARIRLGFCIEAACSARGEVQWTNGYRAGARKGDDRELYEKEQGQWKHCSEQERRLGVALRAYVREAIRARHP